MKLELVKSDCIDDWYTIENGDHGDYDAELQTTENCFHYISARRICDACVEGSAAEMRAIATAIENRSEAHFKRCAVDVVYEDEVQFWSPRNSRMKASIFIDDADELAKMIRKELGHEKANR